MDDGLFTASTNVPQIISRLVTRAEGMFLWARLMVTYIRSPALTPRRRIEAVQNSSPGGLDHMYRKIFQLILDSDMPSQALAAKIFMWVAHSCEAMHTRALHDATGHCGRDPDGLDALSDIENAILISCAGLVEKRPDNTIHFIHLTALDFILSVKVEPRSPCSFVESGAAAQMQMAITCLRYLTFTVPAQPMSSSMTSQLPLLKYSTLHWATHLSRAFDLLPSSTRYEDLGNLLDVTALFLGAPLNVMVWVQAAYTFQRKPAQDVACARDSIQILKEKTDVVVPLRVHQMAAELVEFVSDLEKVEAEWGENLRHGTAEIWNDLTAFTPSRFFARTSALSVHQIHPGLTDNQFIARLPLFTMSNTSPDTTYLAVLGIWPSKSVHPSNSMSFKLTIHAENSRPSGIRLHQTHVTRRQVIPWIVQMIWRKPKSLQSKSFCGRAAVGKHAMKSLISVLIKSQSVLLSQLWS
jgi:hypothetical protein